MIWFILLIRVSLYTGILKPCTSMTHAVSASSLSCGIYCALSLVEGDTLTLPFTTRICSFREETALSGNARLRVSTASEPVHYFCIICEVTLAYRPAYPSNATFMVSCFRILLRLICTTLFPWTFPTPVFTLLFSLPLFFLFSRTKRRVNCSA